MHSCRPSWFTAVINGNPYFFSMFFKKSSCKAIHHIIRYTRNKWICHLCTEAEADSVSNCIKTNEIMMMI